MYQFESQYLNDQLESRSRKEIHGGPLGSGYGFADAPLSILETNVGRMTFSLEKAVATVSTRVRVPKELEALVHWAVWLPCHVTGYPYGSDLVTPNSITALIDDDLLSADSAVCEVIAFFEYWPEFDSKSSYSQHLSSNDCPSEWHQQLDVTPGNLIAALGLAKLDRGLRHWCLGETHKAVWRLNDAWECARLAQQLNDALTHEFFAARHVSGEARRRAHLRHERDPRQGAKAFVFECWLAWRAKPNQYESAAAFARAMLDKKPDDLTSEVVVARWVRQWNARET